MELLRDLGLACLGMIACVAGFWQYMKWSMRRERRALHALPVTPIGALAGGARVRVAGIAEALDGAADRPLIWRGDTIVDAGGNGLAPPPVTITNPFRVTDATGSIEVSTAHLDLRTGFTFSRDAAAVKLASRQPGVLSGGTGEYRIEPGRRLAVIATVRAREDGTLELVGSDREPVIIADP